jgi:DNA invertase Pin-like site-specific DNA recombinase
MSKITSEHLGRRAYVYIRQSTADQVLHNHESRRRQYGCREPSWLENIELCAKKAIKRENVGQ